MLAVMIMVIKRFAVGVLRQLRKDQVVWRVIRPGDGRVLPSQEGLSLGGAQPGATPFLQHLGEERKSKGQVGTLSCGQPPLCSGGILGTGRTQMPGSETGGGVTVLPLGSCQPS